MFNFNIDKRIIYVIIAILVVFSVVNYARNPMELVALLLTLPGVIIAITFHEFAHAFAADKLGDDTPRYQADVKSISTYRPNRIFYANICTFWMGKTSRNKSYQL